MCWAAAYKCIYSMKWLEPSNNVWNPSEYSWEYNSKIRPWKEQKQYKSTDLIMSSLWFHLVFSFIKTPTFPFQPTVKVKTFVLLAYHLQVTLALKMNRSDPVSHQVHRLQSLTCGSYLTCEATLPTTPSVEVGSTFRLKAVRAGWGPLTQTSCTRSG